MWVEASGAVFGMRILHVLNEIVTTGNGIVNVAVDLACEQHVLGHSVAVASGGGGYLNQLQKLGIPHYLLVQKRNPLVLLHAAHSLQRVIRQFRPDIVHAHMMTGAVLARAVRRSRRDYGLVTTVHNEYQRASRLMVLGDRIVGVSQAVTTALVARRFPPDRLRTVPNGIVGSHRGSGTAQIPRVALSRPAVVAVGAVSWRKGSDILVRAFAEIADLHPTAHLYFVGNRDWPDVEVMASRLPGVDRMHFVGFSPLPEVYLRQADVFVLASRQEPFGLVITEAREAGLPVVASDVGGVAEALDGGRAGILVQMEEVAELAVALDRLLTSDLERAQWAVKARHGIEHATVRRMSAEYLAVYQELVSL
jgi:glycosyltransferase involved in cell wall biosynthesis